MAPQRKYQQKLDLHLNIERALKELGDEFNLNPTDVLTEGYIFLINEGLNRYGATDEFKKRWYTFLNTRIEREKEILRKEEELRIKAEESGLQKRILDDDKNRFANWLYSEFYPAFSSDEIRHYAKLVLDNNDNKVRFALESLKKQYTIRSNNTITPWSSEETAQAINHLIELGGI